MRSNSVFERKPCASKPVYLLSL